MKSNPYIHRLRKVSLVLAGVCAAGFMMAQQPLLQKMTTVNAEWKNQTDVAQFEGQTTELTNDRELIRLHLQLVEQTLRARSTNHLSEAQKNARNHHLNNLVRYYESGAFPINTSHDYRLPIFIDPFNNYCAVGHLMKTSGAEDLARGIHDSQNFSYLADIRHDDLGDWVAASGLTPAELAWIQPGYPPSHPVTPMEGGVNGTVFTSMVEASSGDLIIGGDFDEANGTVGYQNLARWGQGVSGPTWKGNLGGGVNGTVHAMVYFNGDLVVGGDFTDAGGVAVNNVARWDGSQWHAMGNLSSQVNALAVFNGDLYAGGEFISPSLSDPFAYFAEWNGIVWSGASSSPLGVVHDLQVVGSDLILGGDFASILGVSGTENIAAYNGVTFTDLDNGLPLPVYALTDLNGVLYAGGEYTDTTDTMGLVVLENNSWESAANIYVHQTQTFVVYDLAVRNNQLLVGGDFRVSLGLTHGDDLMLIDSGMPIPLVGSFNTGVVHNVNVMPGSTQSIFMGGDFESRGGVTVNNVATVDILTSVEEPLNAAVKVEVFPNPTAGEVTVQSELALERLQLTNLEGKAVVVMENPQSNASLDLSTMAPGVYFVQTFANGALIDQQKLVVQ